MSEWTQKEFRDAYRQGYEHGVEVGTSDGRKLAQRGAVLQVIDTRFEDLPQDILLKLMVINKFNALDLLHEKALVVKSLDEFREAIVQVCPDIDFHRLLGSK